MKITITQVGPRHWLAKFEHDGYEVNLAFDDLKQVLEYIFKHHPGV